jgi:uncharacterized OB-fold protein
MATTADRTMWSYLDRGELRAQQCARCGVLRFPPAASCDNCLSAEAEWIVLSTTGTVLSWVTYHRQYFANMPPPYTVVVAEVAEGVLITADLVGDETLLEIGHAVELRFDDAEFDDGGSSKLYRWAAVKRADATAAAGARGCGAV